MDKERLSSKTIFILDCSKEYLNEMSGQVLDISGKTSQKPFTTMKSIYTCCLEAVMEYSRIVWDLFPNGEKCLLFIACSPMSTFTLNNWDPSEQNSENLLNSFIRLTQHLAQQQPEKCDNFKSYLIDGGFRQALMHLTIDQPNHPTFKNNQNPISGRIIYITYKNDTENFISNFKTRITNELNNFNDRSEKKIEALDVIVLNNCPLNKKTNIVYPKEKKENLSFLFESVETGCNLAARLICMSFDHYDLASTTVCNIPMKEEQNSGSSSNYDVEITHSRMAHSKFFDNEINVNQEPLNSSLYKNVSRDGQNYKSMRLKWCTPPKNSNLLEQYHCIDVYRITAVDISSRPTSCLINFLHSGKTVILEMPTKSISHLLRCHNGELYIHVMIANRPLMDDMPSISEGVGGRISDYRINDFANLMKKNRLFKCPNPISMEAGQTPLERSQLVLERQTTYWPISYSFTVFFNTNYNQLQDFYQIISKPCLNEQDMTSLRNIIFEVMRDSQSNSLPIQSNIVKFKGLKKEDLYQILWNEMEHILKCFNVSANHQTILQTFLNVKPKCDNVANNYHQHSTLQTISNTNTNNNIDGLKDYSNKNASCTASINAEKCRKKLTAMDYEQIKTSAESLKNILQTRMEAKCTRPDFVGAKFKKFKLYAGLNDGKNE